MNMLSKHLLVTTGLVALLLYNIPVYADETSQTSSKNVENTDTTSSKGKKNHQSSRKKGHKTSLEASQAESISVSASRRSGGGGMMTVHNTGRTMSTITSEYIDQQSPLATVADLVAVMPGVVSSSDGTGTTTFQNFNMRGMNSSEIGMVMEGMPASNAFSYSAYTPSLVDSQNMGSVSVSQGSVDINAPVYNATGGQISITLRKPSDKMRVKLQASGGSFNSHKEFARIDSGEIGNSGVRAFISASHQSADMWRGYGGMERYHVDAALTKQWSYKSETEVLFGWNQSDSIRMYYPSATDLADGKSIDQFSTNNDPTSERYAKYATKSNNGIYGTVKNHFDFGHGLSLDAQGYSIRFTGPYTYGRSFPSKSRVYNGVYPLPAYHRRGEDFPDTVMRFGLDQWSSQNSGLNLTGTWKHKFNTLKLGYWYSYAVADDQDTYYPITGTGQVLSTPVHHNGHIMQDSNNNSLQQLNQLSLDDKMSFFHRKLIIDGGIRVAMVNRQTTNNLPMTGLPYRRTQINNVFVPAPQMLITYRFNDMHQIYVNATTGYHLPAGAEAQTPTFYPKTPRPASTPINGFKPEYMINEEIGYRYNGAVMFNAAGFHYTVQNYQVDTSAPAPGCKGATASSCLISQLTNAGTLEAFGAQFELATRPWHHFSGYMTGSYLHTSMNNNIATKSIIKVGKKEKEIDDFLPAKGKQETSAPEFMGTLGLSYDDGTTFGRFNLHYVGRQYATLMNDASIPSYFTADLSLGRRLPKIWRIASIATLNISNMSNNHYLSYIYGMTNSYRAVYGTRGGKISGAAPSYGIAQGLAVTASLTGTFE